MINLEEKYLRQLVQVLDGYPEINQAILFGSRAKGTHLSGSDTYLVIKGHDLTPHYFLNS